MARLALLLTFASVLAFAQGPAQPPPPTEISADLGSCSADFRVTDLAGNGLYNAQVHTLIRYGFLSQRKLDLEAGTNSGGKVRFVKLPDQIKKPIIFDIRYQGQTATQSYDPAVTCHASYVIPLKVKEPRE